MPPPKKSKPQPISGKWIDEMVDLTGHYIRLETGDGIVREGRLSGLRTRELQFGDQKVLIPTELEINGDPNDTIPLDRITVFGPLE